MKHKTISELLKAAGVEAAVPKGAKHNAPVGERVPLGDALDATVVSTEDAENADFVVCVRVSDLPVNASSSSVQVTCADCGTKVWRSSTSPKTPPTVCLPCAVVRLKAMEASTETKQ
jgi:hypothetical protein